MSIAVYDEDQVKYNLIKKESILNFRRTFMTTVRRGSRRWLMSINVQ